VRRSYLGIDACSKQLADGHLERTRSKPAFRAVSLRVISVRPVGKMETAMNLTARLAILALICMVPIAATTQAPAQAPAATAQQLLTPQQLEQLVAPIALYPDTLLAQVLMAATYPLEVVQADRWSSQNSNLQGEQLKTAADKQKWDASVKALVATPSVLTLMSTQLEWMQKLGDAVLAQQSDVMDAVQRLRAKAQAEKTLATTKQQTVTTTKVESKEVIVIAPATPNTIYVPYYNPALVYGTWPYAAYPPLYFPPPPGYAVARGLAFGAGFALGAWASGGNYWGGGMNWGNNNIVVNRPVNINNVNVSNFQHNPEHRQGVRYNNTNVQQKYSKNDVRAGNQQRADFRGHQKDSVGNSRSSPKAPATGKAKATPKQRDTAFAQAAPKAQVKSHADRGQASIAKQRSASPRVGAGSRGGAGNRGGRGRR
jgi:hypothetical protein